MVKEYISFSSQAGATYEGFAVAGSVLQANALGLPALIGIYPSIYGAIVQGVVHELGTDDAYLMLAPDSNAQTRPLGLTDGLASEQAEPFLISAVRLYSTAAIENIADGTAKPIGQIKDMSKATVVTAAGGVSIKLEGLCKGVTLAEFAFCTLVVDLNPDYLARQGFIPLIASTAKAKLMPSQLSLNVNTATVFNGRDNVFSVVVSQNGKPVDLSEFTDFILFGLSVDVQMSVDTGAINYGTIQGELVFDLGSIGLDAGTFPTYLKAYSAAYPEGLILWHSQLSAKLSVTVVD